MKTRSRPRIYDLTVSVGGSIVGEATVTRVSVPIPKTWQMTFIEVDAVHRRKGIGARLYKKARHDVGKLGCRLLPHPDLTWDGFYFWMKVDAKALLEVLSLEGSRAVVEQEGGDVDRFEEQRRLVTLWVAETERVNLH